MRGQDLDRPAILPGAAARLGRRRRVIRYGTGLLLVVLLIVLIGPRGQDGAPLDPRSTAPLGTRGVVEVLERLGTTVRVAPGVPDPDRDTVALVISDQLEDSQREGLQDWVRGGGRLVLADPFSALAPDLVGLTAVAFTEPSIVPACDDPLVNGVTRVAVSGGYVFATAPGDAACFPRSGGHWMVRSQEGAGEVISLGGPFTLTNELLGQEDTGLLLVNLLVPADGGRVHVVRPDSPDGGDGTLGDVLPDQVGLALLQLPLAWLALVWWRARRHGRPVEEPTPIRIDAAETTIALGNLLGRAGRAPDAAAIIRARVHAELSRRLGIGSATDPQGFVAVAADRTDLGRDELHRLLTGPLPQDDTQLVRYAHDAATALETIRQHRTGPPGATQPDAAHPDPRSQQQ